MATNRCIFDGYLGKFGKIKACKTGKNMYTNTFSLPIKKKEGEKNTRYENIQIQAYGDVADQLAQLEDSAYIQIESIYKTNKYNDKTYVNFYVTKFGRTLTDKEKASGETTPREPENPQHQRVVTYKEEINAYVDENDPNVFNINSEDLPF